jgi:Zn-dependent alcohol dehydrogenase
LVRARDTDCFGNDAGNLKTGPRDFIVIKQIKMIVISHFLAMPAAGIGVATTASRKNFDFVRSLGATHVFDHTRSGVVDEIVKRLKGKYFAGTYDAITLEDTTKVSAEVTSKLGDGLVVCILPPTEESLSDNVKAPGLLTITIATDQQEVGDAVWRKYVPEAFADGRLQAKSDPIVIGKGLEKVQEGMDKQNAGV